MCVLLEWTNDTIDLPIGYLYTVREKRRCQEDERHLLKFSGNLHLLQISNLISLENLMCYWGRIFSLRALHYVHLACYQFVIALMSYLAYGLCIMCIWCVISWNNSYEQSGVLSVVKLLWANCHVGWLTANSFLFMLICRAKCSWNRNVDGIIYMNWNKVWRVMKCLGIYYMFEHEALTLYMWNVLAG